MRRWSRVLLAVLVLAVSGRDAVAGPVALQNHPAVTDRGETLWVRGTLTQLQPADLTVTIRARGRARVACVDPAGRTSPLGEREVAVAVASVKTMSPAAVVRGTAVFDLVTEPPVLPPSTAVGCPNASWTTRVVDVVFRTVTVRVTQAGRVVLNRTLRI